MNETELDTDIIDLIQHLAMGSVRFVEDFLAPGPVIDLAYQETMRKLRGLLLRAYKSPDWPPRPEWLPPPSVTPEMEIEARKACKRAVLRWDELNEALKKHVDDLYR